MEQLVFVYETTTKCASREINDTLLQAVNFYFVALLCKIPYSSLGKFFCLDGDHIKRLRVGIQHSPSNINKFSHRCVMY